MKNVKNTESAQLWPGDRRRRVGKEAAELRNRGRLLVVPRKVGAAWSGAAARLFRAGCL